MEANQEHVDEQHSLVLSGDTDDILGALSTFFDVSKEEIEAHSRREYLIKPRHTIMFLLREYGGMSFPAIGRLIGNRDHTTVIYAYNKTREEVGQHPEIIEALAGPIALTSALKARRLKVQQELQEMNAKLYAEAMENIRTTRQQKKKPRIRTIPERNLKILEMYREGLTLQNISNVFGLSRERVRQVVLMTIQYLAVNESLTKGIVMDVDILIEEEVKRRKSVQEAKKPAKQRFPKVKRWSRYYESCRKCNLATYKHVREGLCERCLGSFRGKAREQILSEHSNECDVCHMSRPEAMRTYGRDLYIKKNKTVLCKKDFLLDTANRLGKYKYFDWSRHHPSCKGCSTTSVKHAQRGLCMNCAGVITPEQREQTIADHGNKCDSCGMSRAQQRRRFKTDLRLTKLNETLCLNCFQKYIRRPRIGA
jgi:hypothetical protein